MAQTGQQVTLLYGSLVSGTVPAASKLHTSRSGVELAINAADGKMFFKDASGAVRIIADVNSVLGQGTAALTGGTINGTIIGNLDPVAGTFTNLTAAALKLPLTGLLKSTPNGVVEAVESLDYIAGDRQGVANGVAMLDADGKIPLAQLPAQVASGMRFLGVWDAENNEPPISSGIGNQGDFYKVKTAGTTTVDGEALWTVGDIVIFDGTHWQRVAEGQVPVTSVNGQTGVVVITRSSLNAAGAGVNNDITQLAALSTNILVSQGGTGTSSLAGILKGDGENPVQTALPGIDYQAPTTGMANQLLAADGAGGTLNLNLGAGLSIVGNTISSTGGGGGPNTGGTVTSVNVSGSTTGLTFTGGPITHAGTLVLGGVLSVINGGTGKSTITGLLKGNGTSPFSAAVMGTDYAGPTTGTAGQVLASNGTGGFTNVTIGSGLNLSSGVLSATQGTVGGSVTSVQASGGTTGLTFSGGPITSSGILTVGGRLNVSAGGTGVSTISGLLKGNGTSPFSVAVAGTDFAAPPTGAATQLLANNGARGFANVTLGTGLQFANGVLAVTTAQGGGTVTSVEMVGGSTGLKFLYPKVTTEGAITLDGTLGVANGGTGATYIDGIPMSTGAEDMFTAVPGTDYAEAPRGPAGHLLSADGMGGFRYIRLGSGLAFNSRWELTASGSGASVSVKSYGAVGDGVTDDTAAVQAAIDDTRNKKIALFFPSGVYLLTSQVTASGKTTLMGNRDVLIKGSIKYYQATFPVAADTQTPLTFDAPFFRVTGIDFHAPGNTYGLYVQCDSQGSFITTCNIDHCKFYGNYGLRFDMVGGFEMDRCEFNNVAIGTSFGSCTNVMVTNCRWQNQAFAGVQITRSPYDTWTTLLRAGGENIKFNGCEWAVCTYAIYAEAHNWMCIDNSLMDYCGLSIMLQGCGNFKMMHTYVSASAVPIGAFGTSPYYASPPFAGTAFFGKPGGITMGTMPTTVTIHSCEFVNYQQFTNKPLVYLTGYENATYSMNSSNSSFIDCLFMQPGISMATGHSAPTILRIENTLGGRVAFCRFRSLNASNTLTSAWEAPGCTDVSGFGNVYVHCAQNGVQVKSPWDIIPSQVYIQSSDPGNVPPGSIWITP